MHQVRHMPNGYRELRSRFFIAEKNHGSAQLGHDLAVHCNIEMTRKCSLSWYLQKQTCSNSAVFPRPGLFPPCYLRGVQEHSVIWRQGSMADCYVSGGRRRN